MSAAFPNLGDPDIDFTKRPVPELKLPRPVELIVNGVGAVLGVLWAVFFLTFGLLGIIVVAAIFG